MFYKNILGAAAIAITFAAFLPYILSILRGAVRPHVFSWVIWGLTTFSVFLAQLADGAGIGAWPIGVSGAITSGIALLAWTRHADATITRIDWVFFVTALTALPLWYVTADPLWAVMVLTTVDLLGFGPTLRKAWNLPHSESPFFFGLFAARNAIVIAALEHYSATTVLFPAAVGLACILLVALIAWRRHLLAA